MSFEKIHLRFLLFLVLHYVQMSCVQINYIKVPNSVRNNTRKPIIMDCNYSVRSDDTHLVVKWFLNEDPVYQWIPPKKPQSLGVLRDRIDTNYSVSGDDKMAYRAMKIINPTTDIAGTYKCAVSTFADEDFSEKNMIVFEPEKDMKMMETLPKDGKVNFTCIATEVYPKPKITLYRDRKDDIINKNPLEPIEWDTVRHEEDGRFTAFTTATAKTNDLYEGDLINCELRIPATGYVKLKSLVYFPRDMKKRNGASVTHSSLFLIIILRFNILNF